MAETRLGRRKYQATLLIEPTRAKPSAHALELAAIRDTASFEDIPLAHAAILIYARNHRPDLAPYLLAEPQIVLGDMPIYIFQFGKILQQYNDPNTFYYLAEEGARNWPNTKSLAKEKKRAMEAIAQHYADRAPAASTFTIFSNYAGGMTAELLTREKHNGLLSRVNAQIPHYAATVAMELVASVKDGFEPHVLPLFPNPLNGNSLTMNDFIYSGK